MDDYWNPPDGSYTASPTLSPDDPLRAWAQNLSPDDLKLFMADPQKAIDAFVNKGVPPPPTGGSSALGFADAPFMANPANAEPFRLDPAATQKWRDSTPTVQDVPTPQPRPTQPAPTAASAFDPQEESAPASIPLPRERPAEAGPGASELSAQKKNKLSEGLSGFSDSLKGVKPIAPPPLNAVGTPGAPHPAALQTPNIANLLALIGQQSGPQLAAQTLGRLLVAGKA